MTPTVPLFLEDAYLRTAPGVVTGITGEGGIVLDRTVFYARGGGQPGDSGRLAWDGGEIEIAGTVKGEDGAVVLVPASPDAAPSTGQAVEQRLDWERRHRHMRMHTLLHLLSVVVPLPVTGGQIGAEKSRLDFDMPEVTTTPEFVQARLTTLVSEDHPVTTDWVDEARLDADPGLVKTLRVRPPRGAGRVRLVRIGAGETAVDLQPCGGTHVASTGEIGRLRVGKFENKGKGNRRISVTLE